MCTYIIKNAVHLSLKSFRLKCECTKDLRCCLFLLHWWLMFSLNLKMGVLSELLYTDDLLLMSETIEDSGICSENGRRIL